MKIGIIGSGTVGQTLGTGLSQQGHTVTLGSREPDQERIQDWVRKTGKSARADSFEEAAKFGEIVISATQWGGTENALRLAGPKNLAGKVVIDVTNPLDFSKGMPVLAVGFSDSAGERVQRWLPDSKVVKAFNIVTAATMINPRREEGMPDMFIAGNDADAKAKVTRILEEFGWPVIDLGGIEKARLLEPLAMIWIDLYLKTQTNTHAFKLLRK